MLEALRIENLALLEAAELGPCTGFIAITGETGAGKSVLLGALRLLAGAKADKSKIRQGSSLCQVEGVFEFKNHAPVDAALEGLGLEPTEEGRVIIRRVLYMDKPSKASINGAQVTLATLEKFGAHWIDFHGPSEPQKLFDVREQLRLLDIFAQITPQAEAYKAAYTAWQTTARRIDALKNAEQLSEDERAFYETQLTKLTKGVPSAAAIEALEGNYSKYQQREERLNLCAKVACELDACTQKHFAPAIKYARALAKLGPAEVELADRLEAFSIELADLSMTYISLMEEAQEAAADGPGLEEHMNLWMELKRAYGPSVEQVLAKKEALTHKLATQGDVSKALAELELAATREEKAARALAKELTDLRSFHAKKFTAALSERLMDLGFKKAELEVSFTASKALSELGDQHIELLFSPNAGQIPLPLVKMASSGELARVMLALKSVLATMDHTPILVFDEVDANVGGEIGAQVGKHLAALGEHHQVFCVTHLPQVAAQGHLHWTVVKHQDETSTQVEIVCFEGDREGRLVELARMLGDRQSHSARQHALSLLEGN